MTAILFILRHLNLPHTEPSARSPRAVTCWVFMARGLEREGGQQCAGLEAAALSQRSLLIS